MSAYEISTDSARLDVDAIHAFLTRSYWSPGIPRATVARAIANSLCFGAFWQGQQVGFARVVTDRTTFAYLCDVYVLEAHRGHGLAKQLMDRVMKHPDLQGLRRMMLATLDAHGLYAQFGFTALGAPDRIMEVLKPDIYSKG
ncbi:MAG TPA: GNAT family N-acetyltransferase [Steroidobacteraceae bacterium]|jgi:GNAT superfamily N-acetyltransferase|nr:GNAT family N-acetyltransferase [Steroidobacteraceae bacterium]